MDLNLPFKIFIYRLLCGLLITFERVVAAFWRGMVFVAFMFALWLFELPSFFGLVGEIAALLAFISGNAYFFWQGLKAFQPPTLHDIDRRIEIDSAVKGRPLSGRKDRLANPHTAESRDLWAIAKDKLWALLAQLKPAKIRAFMMGKDPYALRFAAFMALALGLVHAGNAWNERLKQGLVPFSIEVFQIAERDRYTLWIDPPEYTRMGQLVLHEKTIASEVLDIPQGSTVKAIVHRGFGTPRLEIGGEVIAFDESTDRSFGVEVKVDSDQRTENSFLKLKQNFMTLGAWEYRVIPDEVPKIAMAGNEQPLALENGEIQFPLSLYDDYGVQYLDIHMRLDPIVEDAPLGEDYDEQRLAVTPAVQDFDINPVYDLTAHPWAGLPVVFEFSARDHLDQVGTLELISFVLPEREFQHPVARTLVALRKQLAWQPEATTVYAQIHYDLEVLLTAEELLHDDVVAYLGIRSAASRLEHNEPSIRIAREVMALMWDTALRIEDGDLSLAARNFRDAQQALEDALQDPDITDEEISALMNELRSAMAEYFTELARDMQKRAQNGEGTAMIPPEMMGQHFNGEALAEFLDKLEQMMRDGEIGSAQEMLSQMQRLMDMLNPSLGGQMPQDMQAMQKGINELEELIKRQEALLEQTLEQAKILNIVDDFDLRDGENVPFVDTTKNAAEQDALRFILGQLMLDVDAKIGEIPQSMGLAEQEMRSSSDALQANDPIISVPHQEQAIAYLKESQQDLAQQLAQRMQQMTGFMIGSGVRTHYDPLGRPYREGDGANGPNSDITIPDEAERRRVEEILQLLRKRAGERGRPREEIEYYRRLLRRF